MSTNGIIIDINSGIEYEKLIRSGKISEDVSLLCDCNGIPVFKCSKCQLWPIQCQIIELDPKEQKIISAYHVFGLERRNPT